MESDIRPWEMIPNAQDLKSRHFLLPPLAVVDIDVGNSGGQERGKLNLVPLRLLFFLVLN
jgi:hypothetical protein